MLDPQKNIGMFPRRYAISKPRTNHRPSHKKKPNPMSNSEAGKLGGKIAGRGRPKEEKFTELLAATFCKDAEGRLYCVKDKAALDFRGAQSFMGRSERIYFCQAGLHHVYIPSDCIPFIPLGTLESLAG